MYYLEMNKGETWLAGTIFFLGKKNERKNNVATSSKYEYWLPIKT